MVQRVQGEDTREFPLASAFRAGAWHLTLEGGYFLGSLASGLAILAQLVSVKRLARVAELADALDSKSSVLYGRVGSSPTSGTPFWIRTYVDVA